MSMSTALVTTLLLAFSAPTFAAPAQKRSALEHEIATRLEAAVGERLALGPEVRISVRQVDLGESSSRGRLVSLELASKGRPLGWVTARATITHKKVERDLWLRAEVVAEVPTLVARHTLERGLTLSEGDVELVLRPLDEDRLDSFEAALGASLRWPLTAGEVVSRRGLDRPDVVTRGSSVQVVVTHPGFVLKAPGEAMDSAGLGEEVSVRLGTGRKVMRGLVTGPGEVEVRP